MSTNAQSISSSESKFTVSRISSSPQASWFTVVLGAFAAGLLGTVVGSYAIDADPAAMATLVTAGYLIGVLLARTWIPDIFAHSLVFLIGTVAALVAITPRALARQIRAGEWHAILDRYKTLLRGFLTSIDSGDKFETDIAIFAIGLTMWLVGYTSAWMLFRRGWTFWSIALPGLILLVTLALERDRPSWPALLYLGLAFAIAAGQTTAMRSSFWRDRGIDQPRTFGRRSIVLGSCIAALAVGVGLYFSFDLDDRFKDRALTSGDKLAGWVSDRFDESSSNSSLPRPTAGNYGAFSDQFKVGDGVPTGDSPVAVIQANGEEYLAARRLNEYDGAGWRSTTSETEGESGSLAPRIAFQGDQPMNIPHEQLQHRAQDEARITMLQQSDRLLFTIDQHFSASQPTLVRVGWQSIDETYDLSRTNISEVPVDLRELIVLLQSSSFSDPSAGETPLLSSPQAALELERVQSRLINSYPVETKLTWTVDGNVQVQVTGRLPIYSDIEAVYSADDLDGNTYSVVGLVPQLAASELESAGATYPDYISHTYLALPDTVTQETRDLANQIVQEAGATNPIDAAVAIQDYLRTNFTYQLDAGPAPSGRDIVDYFLFESKVGRCDHYASSMAVMLRMLGVPTRIVTGLAPVPYDNEMGGYVYRGRNSHAWVEVYFPGYGWIQFEPTPTQATVDLDQASANAIATPEPTLTATASEPASLTPQPTTPTPTATPLPAPASVDTQGSGSGSSGSTPWLIGLGVGLATLCGGAGIYVFKRQRTFTGMTPAQANFGRLQRLGRFIGIEPAPELTPREYAARFGSAKPKAAPGAVRVADAFTMEQYATNIDAGAIARDSDTGWRDAKQGAADWRIWRRR